MARFFAGVFFGADVLRGSFSGLRDSFDRDWIGAGPRGGLLSGRLWACGAANCLSCVGRACGCGVFAASEVQGCGRGGLLSGRLRACGAAQWPFSHRACGGAIAALPGGFGASVEQMRLRQAIFFGCEAFYLKRGAYLYGCGVSFGPALRAVVRCANSDARRREFRIARQTDDAL